MIYHTPATYGNLQQFVKFMQVSKISDFFDREMTQNLWVLGQKTGRVDTMDTGGGPSTWGVQDHNSESFQPGTPGRIRQGGYGRRVYKETGNKPEDPSFTPPQYHPLPGLLPNPNLVPEPKPWPCPAPYQI